MNIGDKVRPNVVGTIFDIQDYGHRVYFRDPSGQEYCMRHEDLEILEAEWQDHDVVIDAEGTVYEYIPSLFLDCPRWYAPGDEDCTDDKELVRPLTLIARDGKPVRN